VFLSEVWQILPGQSPILLPLNPEETVPSGLQVRLTSRKICLDLPQGSLALLLQRGIPHPEAVQKTCLGTSVSPSARRQLLLDLTCSRGASSSLGRAYFRGCLLPCAVQVLSLLARHQRPPTPCMREFSGHQLKFRHCHLSCFFTGLYSCGDSSNQTVHCSETRFPSA
jgi:hypothetical protein